MPDSDKKNVIVSPDASSGGNSGGSSLLPMLIAGLVLIVIGAITVMLFV